MRSRIITLAESFGGGKNLTEAEAKEYIQAIDNKEFKKANLIKKIADERKNCSDSTTT